jgi:hypothetical protein
MVLGPEGTFLPSLNQLESSYGNLEWPARSPIAIGEFVGVIADTRTPGLAGHLIDSFTSESFYSSVNISAKGSISTWPVPTEKSGDPIECLENLIRSG